MLARCSAMIRAASVSVDSSAAAGRSVRSTVSRALASVGQARAEGRHSCCSRPSPVVTAPERMVVVASSIPVWASARICAFAARSPSFLMVASIFASAEARTTPR